MFRPRHLSIVLLAALVGCAFSPTQLLELFSGQSTGSGATVGDVAPDTISDANNPANDSSAAAEAPILLRLSNPTLRDADCSVTMEIVDQEVHASVRRILAPTDSVVIGPDRADIVRVEATFVGQPPIEMDPQMLRIGEDFAAGDTIDVVLALPLRACCFDDGSCSLLNIDDCTSAGGAYQSDETTCDPNPCPPPEGACCFDDGTCEVVTEAQCTSDDGQYQGDDTTCDPNPCPQPGACCFSDGTCTVMFEADCITAEGTYQGDNTTCDPNPCPQPGACCFGDGTCTVMFEADCITAQGTYQGDGTTCDPNLCPQPGACCFDDGTCTVTLEADCITAEGTYRGDGTTCHPNLCPALVCPTDSLLSQPPPDPNDPNAVWIYRESEHIAGVINSLRFENFSEIGEPICDVHWWGLMIAMDPNEQIMDCNDPDPTFEIAFYEDFDGTPDPNGPTCSYTVTPNIVSTGSVFHGDGFDATLLYFSVDPLETCCDISNGWVRISGVGSADCRFNWVNSSEGDFSSYYEVGESSGYEEFDFSVCLTP